MVCQEKQFNELALIIQQYRSKVSQAIQPLAGQLEKHEGALDTLVYMLPAQLLKNTLR
jgi:hypothetical protein